LFEIISFPVSQGEKFPGLKMFIQPLPAGSLQTACLLTKCYIPACRNLQQYCWRNSDHKNTVHMTLHHLVCNEMQEIINF